MSNPRQVGGTEPDRGATPGEGVGSARERRRGAMAVVFRFQSLFGLAAVVLIATILSPTRDGQIIFLDPNNLGNIIRATSEIGILAVGMTFVILTGGIDLSVGSVLGLASVGTATFFTVYDHGIVTTVLAILLIGLVFGAAQGTIITRLRLQAFIVTLAGLQAARGLARIWAGNEGIPITYGDGPQGAPQAFSILTETLWGFLPFTALLFLIVGAIGIWVLRTTTFSRHVYAIGSNEKAARLSGVPVTRVKIAVFAICGMLAALAGIVHAGQLNLGNPNDGFTFELSAIAAVVIGGTSLFGGEGSVLGSMAGALMLGVLDNILTLRGVSADVQLVVTALVIIAAVTLQQIRPAHAGTSKPLRPKKE